MCNSISMRSGRCWLGESISTKMADAGYRVVVTYSPSNTKYRSWLEEMKGRGYSFSAFPIDVVEFDSCARQCSIIQAEVGAIDILVNNAGITRDMTFKKMTKADWDVVLHTNLGSVFKGMRIRRHFHVIHNEARTLSASARAFVDLLGASRIDGAKPGARRRPAS